MKAGVKDQSMEENNGNDNKEAATMEEWKTLKLSKSMTTWFQMKR